MSDEKTSSEANSNEKTSSEANSNEKTSSEANSNEKIVWSTRFTDNIRWKTISYVEQRNHEISTILRHQPWCPQEVKIMTNYGVVLYCSKNHREQFYNIKNLYNQITLKSVNDHIRRLNQTEIPFNESIIADGKSVENKIQEPSYEVTVSNKNSSEKHSAKQHSPEKHSAKKPLKKTLGQTTFKTTLP